jgi:hypothetical protein
MFGIFKSLSKIDTRASTERCHSYLQNLPFEVQVDVAKAMFDCLKLYGPGKQFPTAYDFFRAMQQAKQDCMFRNRLKSHEHPEFSFFQLLEDSAMSGSSKVREPGYSWAITKAFVLEYLPIVQRVTEAEDVINNIDWK